MKILEPGHIYQLQHLDGTGSSLLTFVNREKGTEHEGTQTQEVLRACIDKALHDAQDMNEVMDVLVNRTEHCDACLRWEGNDKIVQALNRAAVAYGAALQNLRMPLVLHEARALERKTEKGQLEPEKVSTAEDGHFVLVPREELEATGHEPFVRFRVEALGEPSTTDYCLTCGESPESGSHILGPKKHDYVDPRKPPG